MTSRQTSKRFYDGVYVDGDGSKLVCHGCAHSVGGDEPYPGRPSGERPCLFCIRNPNQARDLARARHYAPTFCSPRYDNKPVKNVPADQYIATDRLMRDLPNYAHIT